MKIKNRQLTISTYSLIPVVEGYSSHSDVEGIEDTLSSLLSAHKGPLVQLLDQPVLVCVESLGLLYRRICRESQSVGGRRRCRT